MPSKLKSVQGKTIRYLLQIYVYNVVHVLTCVKGRSVQVGGVCIT